MHSISVITINFNNRVGLEATIASVLEQTNSKIEFIIIDGGSIDGSKEVIERFSEQISYWVSEPDAGIYNAMNKGMTKASGEYVIFMNSGDLFYNSDVLKNIDSHLNADIVYGDIIVSESTGQWRKRYTEPMSFLFFTYDTLPHQGTFIKRDLLNSQKNGPYDESMKISSDWKFFIDAICKKGATSHYYGEPVAIYDHNGFSSIEENQDLLMKERIQILNSEYKIYYIGIKELYDERQELRNKLNSRIVKAYFRFRNFFTGKKHHK